MEDLVLRVEPGSLELTAGNIVGRIWIQVGSYSFPEEGWYDFAPPLIVELLKATMRTEGDGRNEEIVSFYDGPFEVRLRSVTRDKLQVTLTYARNGAAAPEGQTFEVGSIMWMKSLIRAAATVLGECDAHSWRSPDIDDLRALISRR